LLVNVDKEKIYRRASAIKEQRVRDKVCINDKYNVGGCGMDPDVAEPIDRVVLKWASVVGLDDGPDRGQQNTTH